jgi:hypothetical protein
MRPVSSGGDKLLNATKNNYILQTGLQFGCRCNLGGPSMQKQLVTFRQRGREKQQE